MKVAVLGPEDHDVFEEVASLMLEEGIETDFLDPETVYSGSDLERYDGVVAKKSRPESLQTLRNAYEGGISAYNGFNTHMRTNHNPASYWHLENADLMVPEWSTFQEIGSEMVKKPRTEIMREEPYKVEEFEEIDGYFCQRYIENGGIDHKLYGVRLQDSIEVSTVDAPSKLLDSSDERKKVETYEEFQSIVEEVMDIFEANMIGVDVISPESGNYIVDVNSAPSYRGTGMEEVLSESIRQFAEGSI